MITKLTPQQIKTLPTPRLLTYYKKYGHIIPGWCGECRDYHSEEDREKGEEWVAYIATIKAELDTREHIE